MDCLDIVVLLGLSTAYHYYTALPRECVCVCARACVCMREREREGEREMS